MGEMAEANTRVKIQKSVAPSYNCVILTGLGWVISRARRRERREARGRR